MYPVYIDYINGNVYMLWGERGEMQKGHKFLNGILMDLERSFRDGLYLGRGIWHLLQERRDPKSSRA